MSAATTASVQRHKVLLTDQEMVDLLDGKVSDEVQAEVDAAAARLAMAEQHADLPVPLTGFIADAVREAKASGRLAFWPTRIRRCPLCKDAPGYVLYKSGPRRGTPNYDRPRTLAGVEVAQRLVSIQGHVTLGGCVDCIDKALPALREALRDVPAQVPAKLAAEGRTAWVRHDNRHCTECDWTGHEGEMGKRRTLMGDGWYPAVCPSCSAENSFGSSPVEPDDGFTVVDGGAA